MSRQERRAAGQRGPAAIIALLLDTETTAPAEGETAAQTGVWGHLRLIAASRKHRFVLAAGGEHGTLTHCLTALNEDAAMAGVIEIQSALHAKLHGKATVRWIVKGEPALRERVVSVLNPVPMPAGEA